jgi:alkaline phosphatase D
MPDRSRRLLFKLASLAGLGFLTGFLPSPAAAAGTLTRIAFGSCAWQWVEQPVWDGVIKTRPDLFLFLGDAIYGDWHGEKPFVPTYESLLRDWWQLGARPGFMRLRQTTPVMATWDNHDYGTHNGGIEFAHKDMSKEVFLDFFGEPQNSQRRLTPGIYDSRIFGPAGKRVQIILLDTRYFKEAFVKDPRSKEEKKAAGLTGSLGNYLPNRDPDVSLLGAAQWKWLEQQLREPAELRLVASSTQVIPDQKGMDEWGNYPRERERLFSLFKATGATNVVLLSGNVHFTEVSQLPGFDSPLLEFTSSGMTHNDEAYANYPNPYRVAGPYAGHNFGVVEIDWSTGGTPRIKMIAMDAGGNPVFEYNLPVG